MRSLHFDEPPCVATWGACRSLHYAKHWLTRMGFGTTPLPGDGQAGAVVLVAQDAIDTLPTQAVTTRVVLWDFQTGMAGTGLQASAASGVSWVIGRPDAPPLALPADMPEKWCGLIGANLALASLLDADMREPTRRRFDVSAADALRSFADQNASHQDLDEAAHEDSPWRRNGSVAVRHGGIYPQGFYRCRDGHVGIIGRSRRDWQAIRRAVGSPPALMAAELDDPFKLAEAPERADALLGESLLELDRDTLLQRAIELGATIAPVYRADELSERNVVRHDFLDSAGRAQLPFRISP